MKERRVNEVKGFILVACSLIILASLISFTPFDLPFYTSHPNNPPVNFIRSFGAWLAGTFFFLFGWAAYLIPAFILFLGYRLFRQQIPDMRLPKMLGLAVLLLSASSLVGLLNTGNPSLSFSRAGFLGQALSGFVGRYFGRLGGFIIFGTLSVLSLVLVTDILISSLFKSFAQKTRGLAAPFLTIKRKNKSAQAQGIKTEEARVRGACAGKPGLIEKIESFVEPKPRISMPDAQETLPLKPRIQIKEKPTLVSEPKFRPQEKMGDYRLPSLELLDSAPPLETRQIKDDLQANARILEETLADFSISVKVTDIERGPVITRYELDPAPGVKLNRIVSLSDDIALAMKAQSVRIIAPIPGKGRVGVEVPNSQSSLVYLKEVLSSREFADSKYKLALALGKDITGQAVVTDLGDMPHILIAGTTGSGKTVCVNSLILALLYKSSPVDLKFVMIDPKMVELMPFNGMPHLLCPVVTDAKKAAAALNWVVNEMEERYQRLAKAGSRNLEAYNQKEEKLPYIVVVVDEFADLMSVARDQIENAVTRLAQLSRAVGIHLILATQRPSVDVITGVIKANLPARVSFKVASKVDSRTVLDMNGADKLLGRGDMLFLRPGESKLIRVQGTLVSDKEIERVVDFIKAQGEPVYDEEILQGQHKTSLASSEKDELYDDAVRVVMESNQASVSVLQRRMRLGYTRAARMIDMMEQEGLVGPFEGSKPRKILIDREAWVEKNLVPGQEEER